MKEQLTRTALVYGDEAINNLSERHIAVFGIGGVGGYVVEALARSGIGHLDLIDNDVVVESNLNRQIIATQDTLGQAKTEVAKKRILSINPDCIVTTYQTFFLPETQDQFDFSQYDYVIDAIDTVTGKLAIIKLAQDHGVPVISSMGTGNKRHPELFEVTDIYSTSVCPLARTMRYESKKRGLAPYKVVYSKEKPVKPGKQKGDGRKVTPGSTAFTPAVAGLIIASVVINELTSQEH